MILFRAAWAIDIVVALIVIAFFFIGIADGTVSSFNIVLWLVILGTLVGLVIGTHVLAKSGRTTLATLVAVVPALPALLYGAFMLVAIVGGARWN